MSDSVFFNSIHILQSLPPGDLKTGENLADRLMYLGYNVPVRLRRPITKSEFLQSLLEVGAEARTGNRSPIVHIEAHGGTRGLEVSSGEFVSWWEMKDALTEINTASRFNLLVVMAACCGGHLIEIVRPTDRAPVWGVIGPDRDLAADRIETDFQAFYDEFFTSQNGLRALERLNDASVGRPWRYAYVVARRMFRLVFGAYVKTMCSPDALKEREDLLVRQIVGDQVAPAELRLSLRADLADHGDHFQKMRQRFFMIDLFPENDQRFRLTLADCLRDPADDPDENSRPKEPRAS